MPKSCCYTSFPSYLSWRVVHTTDKVLGIIGGLGPAATFDFCQRVVRLTNVEVEQDHLQILVDNNPKAPDRNQALLEGGLNPSKCFAESAIRLEAAGADFLAMPCNTAHAYADAIVNAVSIPFVNMVEEAVAEVANFADNANAIGLLATDGCLYAGLFQDRLKGAGYQTILPDNVNQKRLMEMIYQVKKNGISSEIKSEMIALTKDLENNGSKYIIAGCSEVPLVLNQGDIGITLFDTTEWLATIVVEYAKQLRPLGMVKAA